MDRIEKVHRRWTVVQSVLSLIFILLAGCTRHVFTEVSSLPLVTAGLLPAGNLMIFYAFSGREAWSRPANLVSLLRVMITATVFVLQALQLVHWVLLVTLLTAAEILDWLDGRVAVKYGTTVFGGLFDEESDAYFMFAVSILLSRTGLFGPWVLIFGSLRYVFVLFFRFLPGRNVFPGRFRRYSKTVCGIAAGVLIGSFAEILPPAVRVSAAVLALALLTISFLWEGFLRAVSSERWAGLYGLAKSYTVYYLIPFKKLRMKRFYGKLIGKGETAFDIGAHIGNRIRVWRNLGAAVVALEPSPRCFAFLEKRYGSDPETVLIRAAAGPESGTGILAYDPAHPTLASVSPQWIRSMSGKPEFETVMWERSIEVPFMSLDELILRYGRPAFIKIDAEGFDDEVLSGLNTAVRGLSFEYLSVSRETAVRCLKRIERLGRYEYNISRRETMRMIWKSWRTGKDVLRFLDGLAVNAGAGDVYAKVAGPDRE